MRESVTLFWWVLPVDKCSRLAHWGRQACQAPPGAHQTPRTRSAGWSSSQPVNIDDFGPSEFVSPSLLSSSSCCSPPLSLPSSSCPSSSSYSPPPPPRSPSVTAGLCPGQSGEKTKGKRLKTTFISDSNLARSESSFLMCLSIIS